MNRHLFIMKTSKLSGCVRNAPRIKSHVSTHSSAEPRPSSSKAAVRGNRSVKPVKFPLVRLIMLSIEYLPQYGRELVEDVCFRPIPTIKPGYFTKSIRVVAPSC